MLNTRKLQQLDKEMEGLVSAEEKLCCGSSQG